MTTDGQLKARPCVRVSSMWTRSIQLVALCLKRSVAGLSCSHRMLSLMVCCRYRLFSPLYENYPPAFSIAESQLTATKRQAMKPKLPFSRTDVLSSQYNEVHGSLRTTLSGS